MLFGLHPAWAIVILVVVLILFGVGRLPSIGGALGRAITDFRKASHDDDPAATKAEATKKKD